MTPDDRTSLKRGRAGQGLDHIYRPTSSVGIMSSKMAQSCPGIARGRVDPGGDHCFRAHLSRADEGEWEPGGLGVTYALWRLLARARAWQTGGQVVDGLSGACSTMSRDLSEDLGCGADAYVRHDGLT
jgi:hypothetical protein